MIEGIWAMLSGLERGDDVVQGGALLGTGTGVGRDMAFWGDLGCCGGDFAVTGDTWGLESDWDLEG